jgi:hypothetical protein
VRIGILLIRGEYLHDHGFATRGDGHQASLANPGKRA